jgi:hypothetical protein
MVSLMVRSFQMQPRGLGIPAMRAAITSATAGPTRRRPPALRSQSGLRGSRCARASRGRSRSAGPACEPRRTSPTPRAAGRMATPHPSPPTRPDRTRAQGPARRTVRGTRRPPRPTPEPERDCVQQVFPWRGGGNPPTLTSPTKAPKRDECARWTARALNSRQESWRRLCSRLDAGRCVVLGVVVAPRVTAVRLGGRYPGCPPLADRCGRAASSRCLRVRRCGSARRTGRRRRIVLSPW